MHSVSYASLLVLVLLVGAVFPVRVLPSEADGSQQSPLQIAPSVVELGDYFFSPRNLNVSTGTTVVWNYSQTSGAPHTVTSENQTGGGSPIFASPNMRPGDTFSFPFNLPGVYRYFCAFHPTLMRNVWVNVTGTPVSTSEQGNGLLILVAGGIGAAILVAVLAVFLVGRRRSSTGPTERV